MIKKRIPLSMAETAGYSKENEELQKFVKNFTKIQGSDASKLREKLSALGMMKMKDEHIVKIIDMIPEDEEDLSKVFSGVSLDENEAKNILDTIKEFK